MKNVQNTKSLIDAGGAILGCELGSTTIKATLVSPEGKPLSSGSHQWETRLVEKLPDDLKGSLPTVEEIEAELGDIDAGEEG